MASVQLARYTARGNLAVLVDSGGIVAGQRDSTRYVWNAAFDVVERIVPQLGDSLAAVSIPVPAIFCGSRTDAAAAAA
ncbi:hypothetical protein [Gemmatimonas sp.]